ncbi:MAG: hypothetical protein VYE73_01820 [Acidobacteriota bacterium]|nr:hypothetical protein [Acidobacteriota bacterium]
MSETTDSRIQYLKPASGTETGESAVPRRCTLHGFAEEVAGRGGLSVEHLDPISPLVVHTENTAYEITVLDPRSLRILVQGGSYFPHPTPALLEGSSFGGSLLKQGWIGAGLRMEICAEGLRVVTSRVQSIEVRGDGSLPGPF